MTARQPRTSFTELAKDAARYQWVKPIMSGEDTTVANERTILIAYGLAIKIPLNDIIDEELAKVPA